MSRLERLLGVERQYLRDLASRAGGCYSPFPKADRQRPFARKAKTAKRRIIDNPSSELKIVQSLIANRLLKPLTLPEDVCGGIKGKSVLDNVRLHQHSKVLAKIDIARFFPSVTNKHVYEVWANLLGCSPRISGLLTRLTTFERHLPQGAPSSTHLANLVLYSDGRIRTECERLGIQPSSWIDDLAYSSENPRPIINMVVGALRESGFRISRKKLEIAGPGKRKILNGVLIGGARLSVPPDRLARIRSGIHKLRQSQIPTDEVDRYVRALRGSIAHVAMINPVKASRLRADLEAAILSRTGP
jgi:RNA-directed DNA polymerase